MLVVLFHVEIKQDEVGVFKQAYINNAKNSIKEPKIAQFDIVQDQTRAINLYY